MSNGKVTNWITKYYKKHSGFIAMLVIFFIFYLVLVFLFRHFDINQERITSWINQFGAYLIFALFLVQLIGSITPIPDSLITAIGMILFGPFLGGFIIFWGMYAAGCIHFFIARKLGRAFIVRKFPEVGNLAEKFNNKNVVIKLTYLRMFMLVAFDIASYVAGVSNVSFWQFTLSFFLGLTPHLISYGFITQGLVADGSPLNIIPGVTIFLAMLIIANWPRRDIIK